MDNLINKPTNSVDRMYRYGLITQLQYEAYCWLWRNSAYHFSSLNHEYEGQPIPDGCYDLVKPYFYMVNVEFFIKDVS